MPLKGLSHGAQLCQDMQYFNSIVLLLPSWRLALKRLFRIWFFSFFFNVADVCPFLQVCIMAGMGDNTSEANKLLGQSNYNMWKFKVKNSLLREDLIDHMEKKDLKLKASQKIIFAKQNRRATTFINIFCVKQSYS